MKQQAARAQQRPYKYRFVSRKGSGAFADVIQAENVQTGEMVAIKRIKQVYKSIEEVQQLREVQALKALQNSPTVINLREILYDRSSGRLALVCELMSCNLYEIIQKRQQALPERQVRLYFFYILDGLASMHQAGFFHRDIKPENVLIRKQGASYLLHQVKLADVGSCRQIGTALPYTEYISTRWYRAPETLLSDGVYGQEMDIFGCGCVLFEIAMLYPLFPGKDELDQINRIHAVLGTPAPEVLRRLRGGAVNNPIRGDFAAVRGCGLQKVAKSMKQPMADLLAKMLEYDPQKRISALKCLAHAYFDDVLDILAEALDAGADEQYIRHLERTWRAVRGNDQRAMRRAARGEAGENDYMTNPRRGGKENYQHAAYNSMYAVTATNAAAAQQAQTQHFGALPPAQPGARSVIQMASPHNGQKIPKKPKHASSMHVVPLIAQAENASPQQQSAYLPAPLPALVPRLYKVGHKIPK